MKATNAVFRLKGIPIFYTPYLVYPISHDGRSSGILFPHVGYSSDRAATTSAPASSGRMGRSADQTFYADYCSKLGNGFGHELRYALQSPSRGNFRTYVFDVKGAEELDHDLDWNALQILPGKVKVALNVRQYSDLLFQQRYQDDFNAATSRTQRWQGSIEKDLKLAVLSALRRHDEQLLRHRLHATSTAACPGLALRRFPRQIGWGKVVVGSRRHRRAAPEGGRGESRLLGALRRGALHLAALQPELPRVHASARYRYTRYGASYGTSLDENGDAFTAIVGPPLDRSFYETQVEMRGPTFCEGVDTPGFAYFERFKHVIGPEVSWTLPLAGRRLQLAIPKFDGNDYLLGTNQINYSLVQRFFAKRRGPSGKLPALRVPELAADADLLRPDRRRPEQRSIPTIRPPRSGPGFACEHLSPLLSRLKLKPTPGFWPSTTPRNTT